MSRLTVGLLSLMAVSSAAKLGGLPAATAQHRPPRLPAFGDRLSPLKRLRRPLFLPFPPGVRPAGNFSSPLLRLPADVRRPGNGTVPVLMPFLRGPGNVTSPLFALPPPGLVLPANFSTRVARHHLPLLVRPVPTLKGMTNASQHICLLKT